MNVPKLFASAHRHRERKSFVIFQMLTINLEESDCFAAWISVTDVPGLEPKIIDGKGEYNADY